MVELIQVFKDAWTAQVQLVLFALILATIIWNVVAIMGGLRALREAENPINAHLIGPVYERYANFPKALRALALVSMMVGVLGWSAQGYLALSEAASLPGTIIARDLCARLGSASLILAIGALNAVLAYSTYCLFSGILAMRYSRSIHKLADRRAGSS